LEVKVLYTLGKEKC